MKLLLTLTIFTLGFITGRDTAPVRIIQYEVMVETKVPVYLPVKQTAYVKKQEMILAAQIPASALGVK